MKGEFTIQTFDEKGNEMTTGGVEFEISIIGKEDENELEYKVEDHLNGKYTCHFAGLKGTLGSRKGVSISVKYLGEHIGQSPYPGIGGVAF